MNELQYKENPLLSQEGWREAPGWFQKGTTPRGIRFAIPLPAFLDCCALPGLHSQPLVT